MKKTQVLDTNPRVKSTPVLRKRHHQKQYVISESSYTEGISSQKKKNSVHLHIHLSIT